jgi:hypothetical protein
MHRIRNVGSARETQHQYPVAAYKAGLRRVADSMEQPEGQDCAFAVCGGGSHLPLGFGGDEGAHHLLMSVLPGEADGSQALLCARSKPAFDKGGRGRLQGGTLHRA